MFKLFRLIPGLAVVTRGETPEDARIDRAIARYQTGLAVSIGQVECPGNRIHSRMHEFWTGRDCPACKAVV